MKTIYLLLLFVISTFLSIGQNSISLIQPYDKDTIETVYPVFSWYGSDLAVPRGDVQYVFTLVELSSDQSANAGLIVNTPLIRIENIQGFQFSYPFDAPDLKYNRRYGWRLQKKSNGIIVSESESWEFILYKKVEIPRKYAVLSTDFNATIYEVNKVGFYFKLKSRYKSNSKMSFKVLNEKLQKMSVVIGEDEKLTKDEDLEPTGRDFFFLKTDVYPVGTYTLIVQDQKGNAYNARFRVK